MYPTLEPIVSCIVSWNSLYWVFFYLILQKNISYPNMAVKGKLSIWDLEWRFQLKKHSPVFILANVELELSPRLGPRRTWYWGSKNRIPFSWDSLGSSVAARRLLQIHSIFIGSVDRKIAVNIETDSSIRLQWTWLFLVIQGRVISIWFFPHTSIWVCLIWMMETC